MPTPYKQLSLSTIEQIAKSLAKQNPVLNSCIIGFTKKEEGVLEACLAAPFIKHKGQDVYKTLEEKASVLFFELTHKKPFKQSNSRMAMAILFYFMAINGRWLEVTQDSLLRALRWTVESPEDAKAEVINYLTRFIAKHIKQKS